MAWLLDVNCLIALVDPFHVHHDTMHKWFQTRNPEVFGTCAITEIGLVRVLSQPTYPGGGRPPAEVIGLLATIKRNHQRVFQMLPNDVSISDSALFAPEYVAGAKRITDAYLLGLAFSHNWRLVSFDRSLPWQAIRGATASLVENPAKRG